MEAEARLSTFCGQPSSSTFISSPQTLVDRRKPHGEEKSQQGTGREQKLSPAAIRDWAKPRRLPCSCTSRRKLADAGGAEMLRGEISKPRELKCQAFFFFLLPVLPVAAGGTGCAMGDCPGEVFSEQPRSCLSPSALLEPSRRQPALPGMDLRSKVANRGGKERNRGTIPQKTHAHNTCWF